MSLLGLGSKVVHIWLGDRIFFVATTVNRDCPSLGSALFCVWANIRTNIPRKLEANHVPCTDCLGMGKKCRVIPYKTALRVRK